MTKMGVSLGLLVSAFAPLLAVLTLLQWDYLGGWAWLVLGVCAASLVLLPAALLALPRVQSRTLQPKQVKHADEAVLGFTGSYIVPIAVAAFSKDDFPTFVATAALLLLMTVIYVRGGLYHLNPTLALLGYRLYEVTETNEVVTMLLTRSQHVFQTEPIEAHFPSERAAVQLGAHR